MPHSENAHVVYIVSDATGETAYRVTRAALAQFKDTLIEPVQRHADRAGVAAGHAYRRADM